MPESEEERIASLLKGACGQVRASVSFKERLLSHLLQEGQAIHKPQSRRLWARPLVWAPVAVAVLVLIVVYVAIGLPGRPPLIASVGSLKLYVTDAPPQRDVTEINVILSNVEVSKYVEGEDDGTWLTVVIEGKVFDLIKLRDTSMEALLGEQTLETGLYLQIRMDVEIIDAVIDGERVEMGVTLPSGKLKMVSSFEIRENETTVVTIDFDADKSLVFTGSDKVIFKPVVKLIVAYQ